jgi:hypothetical protein
MSKSSDLSDKIGEFIAFLEAKNAEMERTGTPIPHSEHQRNISIAIELNQQYIDLLDEVKEELELAQEESDQPSPFSEFSKRFDVWFAGLSPEQVEQVTRKGEPV